MFLLLIFLSLKCEESPEAMFNNGALEWQQALKKQANIVKGIRYAACLSMLTGAYLLYQSFDSPPGDTMEFGAGVVGLGVVLKFIDWLCVDVATGEYINRAIEFNKLYPHLDESKLTKEAKELLNYSKNPFKK